MTGLREGVYGWGGNRWKRQGGVKKDKVSITTACKRGRRFRFALSARKGGERKVLFVENWGAGFTEEIGRGEFLNRKGRKSEERGDYLSNWVHRGRGGGFTATKGPKLWGGGKAAQMQRNVFETQMSHKGKVHNDLRFGRGA